MQIMIPRPPRSRLSPTGIVSATLVLLASLVGCGGTEPVDPPSAPPAKPGGSPAETRVALSDPNATRVAFLGDSLSAGYGLPADRSFPALLEALLREEGFPVDVINAGVSGDTTAGGLSRVDWVLRSEPDVLVVELGANDALRGQPLDNTEKNLREIIRRGRAAGAQVLLLGMDLPTNYGREYSESFVAIFPRLAREEQVALVPGFMREVGLDPGLTLPDGLHPNVEGHRRKPRRPRKS